MISICVTIKNRSRVKVGEHELLLFPNCVKSIVKAARNFNDIELVVTDWESDDWPLNEWLQDYAGPVRVRVISLQGTFSRGRGLNVAAQHALGDQFLFTDADSLLCSSLLESGQRNLCDGKAFFPVLYSFDGPEHRSGWWRHTGYGNCIVTRSMFEQAGGWPEYESWGKEDDDFFSKISAIAPVVREEVQGFFHQWHPDDVGWKSRYGSQAGLEQHLRDNQEQQNRILQALNQIRETTLRGQMVILVNEDQWPCPTIPQRRVLPFLERDGHYWGLPENDAAGIDELERMQKAGAHFIVFAWPAFWWLDHYKGLHSHLRAHYHCVLENDDLKIFELSAGKKTER